MKYILDEDELKSRGQSEYDRGYEEATINLVESFYDELNKRKRIWYYPKSNRINDTIFKLVQFIRKNNNA